jgi:hypothetical protein
MIDNPIENENHSHLDNVQADTMPDALKGNDISMDNPSTDMIEQPESLETIKDKGGRPPHLPNARHPK